MARVVITPWRSEEELFQICQEFYPPLNSDTDTRRHACNMVAAWKVRGGVPHVILSTAYLTDAILSDVPSVSIFSKQGAYANAFSRFITGLADIEQNARQKKSMFDVAKEIGLPASFIELRHRIAHEDMPNLKTLQDATQRALKWLYNDYWTHIVAKKHKRDVAIALAT